MTSDKFVGAWGAERTDGGLETFWRRWSIKAELVESLEVYDTTLYCQ